jgi:hypothetical protein
MLREITLPPSDGCAERHVVNQIGLIVGAQVVGAEYAIYRQPMPGRYELDELALRAILTARGCEDPQGHPYEVAPPVRYNTHI